MIHLICPNPAVDRTILLENFRKSVPNRPEEVKDFPGGKSFNVAYAIQKEEINEKVIVHTMLGGENGKRVIKLAKESNIDVEAIHVNKNTRECNIIVDTVAKEIFPIYEKGFELSEDTLKAFTNQIINSVSSNDYLVFSGSLMEGMPSNYISYIQEKINNPSVKLYIDTSSEALKSAYKETNAYVIKINDEEYNELFNTTLSTVEDFADHMQENIKQTCKLFIVTLGSEGAVVKKDNEIIHYKAESIQVKNPVASGDYFLGALIRGDLNEDTVDQTIKRAMAYSTSNCLYWYPNIEIADLEEIAKKISKKIIYGGND